MILPPWAKAPSPYRGTSCGDGADCEGLSGIVAAALVDELAEFAEALSWCIIVLQAARLTTAKATVAVTKWVLSIV